MSIAVEAIQINLQKQSIENVEEIVALEAPSNIYLNGKYLVTLLSTPYMRKELAFGWLLSEGILQSLSEVEKCIVKYDDVEVFTKIPRNIRGIEVMGVTRLYTTACGLSAAKFNEVVSTSVGRSVFSEYRVKAADVLNMVKELEKGKLFKLTGGTHVSALFERGKLITLAEDVGRHNTVDKIIGKAAMLDVDFSMCVLVSSGRQPADMVLKAARVGIPIVVSKAAPVRSGLIASEKTGITLICFVRNNRMNVYSHPFRVQTDI